MTNHPLTPGPPEWRVVLQPDNPRYKAAVRWWDGKAYSTLPKLEFFNEARAKAQLREILALENN